MIINGNSRGGAAQLGKHLQRADTNETIDLLEIHSPVEDVTETLRDWQFIASGTLGKKGLYHASINPDHHTLTKEQWLHSVDVLEKELGFTGQPRLIMLHEKEGREHIHVVWQRTDIETMTLRTDSKNYAAHERASLALEMEFGHEKVLGKHAKRDRQQQPDFPRAEATHAENQQAERTGIDPKAFKESITALYHQCDSGQSFKNALEERGIIFATGDKRGFVIVDEQGEVYSLSRQLLDVKAKDMKELLKNIGPLPNVEEAKTQARELRRSFDAEMERFFSKPEEFSDEWVRKFDQVIKHRWDPAAAEQQRIERQKQIDDIRTRHRIEKETLNETQKLERLQQIEDFKASQANDPANPQPHKITPEQLAKLETALKERHDNETRQLNDRQQNERLNTIAIANEEITRKIEDLDAMQEAARILYDREHKTPEGLKAAISGWMNPEQARKEAEERERQKSEFLEQLAKDRAERIDYFNNIKADELQDLADRHAQQQRDHAGKYQEELTRYTTEHHDSQKLLAEEQHRQQEFDRKPDEPEPPKPSL